MELKLAELALESLDVAEVEAAALFIVDEDRPLRGLAGLCDWRMCGALSRALAGGWYRGGLGETLLMPTQVGLRAMRVFVFGLGPGADLRGGQVMAEALPRAFQTLRKAKVGSCCLSLPWPGGDLDSSLELWAGQAQGGPERQLVLGDVRQIQRWFEGAASRFPAVRIHAPDAGAASLRVRGVDATIQRVGRDRSTP